MKQHILPEGRIGAIGKTFFFFWLLLIRNNRRLLSPVTFIESYKK